MAKLTEIRVSGLSRTMRALRRLPKEAGNEMRLEAQLIAQRRMVPAWQEAARLYAQPWGEKIAQSVRVRRDRIPSVQIGYQKKVFGHGGSTNIVRFPTYLGPRGDAPQARAAFRKGTKWIEKRQDYRLDAMRDWTEALNRVLNRWESM